MDYSMLCADAVFVTLVSILGSFLWGSLAFLWGRASVNGAPKKGGK